MRHSLRLRLLATVALLVVPLAIGIALVQSRLEHRLMVSEAASSLYERAESQRTRCESLSGDWPRANRRGRHRRSKRPILPRGIAVYSDGFQGAKGRPVLAPQLEQQFKDGADTAVSRIGKHLFIGVRMPYDGPCAIVVQRRAAPRRGLTNILLALAVSFAAACVAFISAGPLVRRIRVLHHAVESKSEIIRGKPDELGLLAVAFSQQRTELSNKVQALEDRDRTLTDYVANTTHDVMIPLSVLKGHLIAIETAGKEGQAPDPTRVAQAIEEAHYLGALVANLNVAAKLETGSPDLLKESVDLCALVSRVHARHQPVARRKGIEVAYSVPEECLLQGDETLLEQALSNVVHNAIRYNHSGGHVAVVLSKTDSAVMLEIGDDGPGVSEEELSRLGERSYRTTTARQRHASGTGLGLSIAKDVAEKHAGSLTLSINSEGGLQVLFELPS